MGGVNRYISISYKITNCKMFFFLTLFIYLLLYFHLQNCNIYQIKSKIFNEKGAIS